MASLVVNSALVMLLVDKLVPPCVWKIAPPAPEAVFWSNVAPSICKSAVPIIVVNVVCASRKIAPPLAPARFWVNCVPLFTVTVNADRLSASTASPPPDPETARLLSKVVLANVSSGDWMPPNHAPPPSVCARLPRRMVPLALSVVGPLLRCSTAMLPPRVPALFELTRAFVRLAIVGVPERGFWCDMPPPSVPGVFPLTRRSVTVRVALSAASPMPPTMNAIPPPSPAAVLPVTRLSLSTLTATLSPANPKIVA